MPRDIPLGNGRLLVAFDRNYAMRDLYYPHVGLENHLMGRPCRIGVRTDAGFSWVGSPGWSVRLAYEQDALVSDVKLENEAAGLAISVSDAVEFERPLLVRRFRVKNREDKARQVRVYFHHDFEIMESDAGNTAHFDPRLRGIIHYKRRRYFLLNVVEGGEHGVAEYSTSRKRKLADGDGDPFGENGRLDQNAIAHGAVDSVIAVTVDLDPGAEQEFWTFLIAGDRYQDVAADQAFLLSDGCASVVARSRAVSQAWCRKDTARLEGLGPEAAALFRRSLLVLGTQCDHDGGILAANDTDIMGFARDTYSYVWPRDGALVARALDLAGHARTARRFYWFCVKHVSQGGYFFQKYNADGSLASSWHPWVRDGKEQIPIQEDETALVLWALAAHFGQGPDFKFLIPSHTRFVRRAADFLYDFRDPETGLPHPSWDLWEERFGVHAFTVASVHAGLRGAARMTRLLGDEDLAARYETGAAEVLAGFKRYLFHDELGRYVRMGTRQERGYFHDLTVDSALCGLFLFDMLPLDDPRLVSTIDAVEKRLWIDSDVGGVARYENDYYHQVSKDVERIPGNPWFVCTLWLAEWHARRAKTKADLERAFRYLDWAKAHARPSGVMAEQVDPLTGDPVSVAPLTWSHAAYVSACIAVARRQSEL
jgi:GH15 family glucan-1,4-alpha-glucosidase